MELLMKFLLGIGHYVCKLIYYLLLYPAKCFSYFERLLIREDKRSSSNMGFLYDYFSDELTTKVEDKKKEKERREDIEKLVKDLEKLKEIAIIKKVDTLKVAEFYEVHKNQFNRNLSAKEFCRLICVQFGIDYNDNIYRNFQNNCLKVAELR